LPFDGVDIAEHENLRDLIVRHGEEGSARPGDLLSRGGGAEKLIDMPAGEPDQRARPAIGRNQVDNDAGVIFKRFMDGAQIFDKTVGTVFFGIERSAKPEVPEVFGQNGAGCRLIRLVQTSA
jgi:hypothetical protein